MNYYKINIVQKLIKIKLMMEYFNMGGGITPPLKLYLGVPSFLPKHGNKEETVNAVLFYAELTV